MAAEWKLTEAVEMIRRAGLDPARWPEALSYLSETIGSTGAVVFGTDRHVVHAPSSSSLSLTMDEYSRDGWYERDSRRNGVVNMLTNGIMTDFDLDSYSIRSEFYRDFLVRHKCENFAGLGFMTGNDLWCLALQRSASNGPFQADELKRLRTLWRPLGDAATLTRLLADRHSLSTLEALEMVEHAALVCDSTGSIIGINQTAEGVLGKSYKHLSRSIFFDDAKSNDALKNIISQAVKGVLTTDMTSLSCIVICEGGNRLAVRAINLGNNREYMFYGARLLLLLKKQPLEFGERMQRYGLTKAELVIAQLLGSGANVAEIANKKEVRENTIRIQLKSIYAKTGVHTQAQLVALLHGKV